MRKVGETVYGTVTSLATALEFPISVLKVRGMIQVLLKITLSCRILLDPNIGCQMPKLLLVLCVTGFSHFLSSIIFLRQTRELFVCFFQNEFQSSFSFNPDRLEAQLRLVSRYKEFITVGRFFSSDSDQGRPYAHCDPETYLLCCDPETHFPSSKLFPCFQNHCLHWH